MQTVHISAGILWMFGNALIILAWTGGVAVLSWVGMFFALIGIALSLIPDRSVRKEPARVWSKAMSALNKLGLLVWLGGTILVVLSWNGTVSASTARIGFWLTVVGVAFSVVARYQPEAAPVPREPLAHAEASKWLEDLEDQKES